jgi:hypothetical protein
VEKMEIRDRIVVYLLIAVVGAYVGEEPYHFSTSSMAFSEYPLFFRISLIEETSAAESPTVYSSSNYA